MKRGLLSTRLLHSGHPARRTDLPKILFPMRSIQLGFISFGWLIFFAFTGCGGATGPAGNVPNTPATSPDHQAIQGVWIGMGSYNGIELDPELKDFFAVFTATEAKTSGPTSSNVFYFRLDPASQPRRLDLEDPRFGFVTRCVYEIRGDELWLSLPLEQQENTPAPHSIEPGEGRSVAIYRRFDEKARASWKAQQKPLNPREAAAVEELRASLDKSIELARAGKGDDFVAQIYSPADQARLAADPGSLLSRFKRKPEFCAAFATLLAAACQEQPKLNEALTEITFDARLAHVNSLREIPFVRFVRVDGQWCYQEPKPDLWW